MQLCTQKMYKWIKIFLKIILVPLRMVFCLKKFRIAGLIRINLKIIQPEFIWKAVTGCILKIIYLSRMAGQLN